MTTHKCHLTGSTTYEPCYVGPGQHHHRWGCIYHYREEREPDSNATLGLEQPEYRSDAEERRPGIGWLS